MNLYEISWEVCNKVGGIYRVLESKSHLMKGYKKYIQIGPYLSNSKQYFEEKKLSPKLDKINKELNKKGINIKYGEWLIKGRPNVILVDFKNYFYKKDDLKKELWESHKVESLFSSYDFDEPVVFSGACAELISLMDPGVTHLHEWMAGITGLFLKNKNNSNKIVFTTHATILGRSMTGAGLNLYEEQKVVNPYEKAKELNILDKYTAERGICEACDVLTTVSDLTSEEVAYLNGRKPDLVLKNGLDSENFPSLENLSVNHKTNKSLLKEFASYTFFPHYRFDLDLTKFYFTSGRYEYRSKGFDLLIDSLGKLDQELKNEPDTIIFFFFLALPDKGPKEELVDNKSKYNYMKKKLSQDKEKIRGDIIKSYIDNKNLVLNNKSLKDEAYKFKREHSLPIICTHNSDIEEELVRELEKRGLRNSKENRVKVIIYPAYLDGSDGVLNMTYEEAITGCQLGVFPSYYEPWGYTPLECAAYGVPAITTDYAGFGLFLEKLDEHKGIYVLDMEHEGVNELKNYMYTYTKKSHHERFEDKLKAKNLSKSADWKKFIRSYFEAHKKAYKTNI